MFIYLLLLSLSFIVITNAELLYTIEENHCDLSLYNTLKVFNSNNKQIYKIQDSFNWNKDLYMYDNDNNNNIVYNTDIKSFGLLRKQNQFIDSKTKTVMISSEQEFSNWFWQSVQQSTLQYLTGSSVTIPKSYRRYTVYDSNQKENGYILKQEALNTDIYFVNNEDKIYAQATKKFGSKLASLVCKNPTWEINIYSNSNKYIIDNKVSQNGVITTPCNVPFVLLTVADKARHDMNEVSKQRNEFISSFIDILFNNNNNNNNKDD